MPGPLPLTGSYPAPPPDPSPGLARRILAVWLMRLAIDRWRLAQGLAAGEGADAAPLALIEDTAHGPRIAAANAAGIAAGARAGMMLADARTLCSGLAVAPADPAGDLAFLETFALWARRWGPWSALDPPDGLVVDVTGVAHLFGGEQALLADLHEQLERRRLAARAAIAPTAGAAWALAHHGRDGAIFAAGEDVAASLATFPVAALRLDEATLLVLKRLGLKRIGDLHGVAREALSRRFRNRHAPAANPLVRLDQLIGRVPEPMLPVLPQQVPLVQRRLMEPVRHRDLLDRVVADLAEDMARALEGKALGARRLELGMWKVDGEVAVRHLELAAPSRDAGHIAGLLGRKLDDLDAGFGIELVRLRSTWSEPLALSQGDFEQAAEAHGTSLSACIDRLRVRLGTEAVRRPVPRASHVPERAQVLSDLTAGTGRVFIECGRDIRPDLAAPAHSPTRPPNGSIFMGGRVGEWAGAGSDRQVGQKRPLKLLDAPERIAVLYASPDGLPRRFRWRGQVHEVVRAEGPERIAPEWWRERSTARLRDYYRIEDGEGRRYWIYRLGIAGDGRGNDKQGRAPEWFLQGLWG